MKGRTLFVTPHVPFPKNVGGNLRPYHMLRALARVSAVSLVCAVREGDHPDHLAELRALCHDVFFFPDTSFRWRRTLRARLPRLRALLEHLDPFEPTLLKSYHSGPAKALLQARCRQPIDLVWVEGLHLLPSLPSSLSSRVIVNLADVEHRKLARKLRALPPSRRSPFDMAEFLKTRALERSLARRGWEVAVCSEVDRRALGPQARVWVVPNGIDLPTEGPVTSPPPEVPTFVFVGAMFYEPNIDAVHFFAREIFPLIRRRLPRARFVVVGRDPRPDVVALADGSGITVTGTVDDVSPHLAAASVAVIPIRYGSGTRIKILEAFAHKVPVVSTTMGAEGLEVTDTRDLLLADDPRAFASACVRLACDRPLRDTVTGNGYGLVARRYQWREIERLVQRIALSDSADADGIVCGAPAQEAAP